MGDLPLKGRTVALAESRELDTFARMLERVGATTVRCPLISILDNPDEQHVGEFLDRLLAGEFEDLVCYTGEGVRRLAAFAERRKQQPEFVQALASVRKITRGPKPARALKEMGLTPDIPAQTPTTDGLIQTMADEDVSGRKVAVQLFAPDQTQALMDALRERGAEVATVSPYIYAPESDREKVAQLIDQIASGSVDVVTFTSASQVDRLWEVSEKTSSTGQLETGLQSCTVAAVGPVVEEALRRRSVRVDVSPETSYFMKPLVDSIVACFTEQPDD